MTRSGSLAYYLAGVVCGSFFYTLAHFITERPTRGLGTTWAGGLLEAFFIGTIFGWFPQIVAAFLLRRAARPLRWTEAWHWVVGGAGIFLLVFLILGILGAMIDQRTGGLGYGHWAQVLFGQATLSVRSGIWQGLAAGAATSFVLYRVNRAFLPQESPGRNSARERA